MDHIWKITALEACAPATQTHTLFVGLWGERAHWFMSIWSWHFSTLNTIWSLVN